MGLLSVVAAKGAIVQVDSRFVAFNAELGTIDDDPANASKFDVMAPDGGSFGSYLRSVTVGGTVTFDVEFAEATVYTVYARYREVLNTTPTIELDFDGLTTDSNAWTDDSTTFAWLHINDLDLTSAAMPGGETVTIRSAGVNNPGETFDFDAFALVKQSEIHSNGFVVNDTTIPESALSLPAPIPEPSSALMLLLGNCLLFIRRRKA